MWLNTKEESVFSMIFEAKDLCAPVDIQFTLFGKNRYIGYFLKQILDSDYFQKNSSEENIRILPRHYVLDIELPFLEFVKEDIRNVGNFDLKKIIKTFIKGDLEQAKEMYIFERNKYIVFQELKDFLLENENEIVYYMVTDKGLEVPVYLSEIYNIYVYDKTETYTEFCFNISDDIFIQEYLTSFLKYMPKTLKNILQENWSFKFENVELDKLRHNDILSFDIEKCVVYYEHTKTLQELSVYYTKKGAYINILSDGRKKRTYLPLEKIVINDVVNNFEKRTLLEKISPYLEEDLIYPEVVESFSQQNILLNKIKELLQDKSLTELEDVLKYVTDINP